MVETDINQIVRRIKKITFSLVVFCVLPLYFTLFEELQSEQIQTEINDVLMLEQTYQTLISNQLKNVEYEVSSNSYSKVFFSDDSSIFYNHVEYTDCFNHKYIYEIAKSADRYIGSKYPEVNGKTSLSTTIKRLDDFLNSDLTYIKSNGMGYIHESMNNSLEDCGTIGPLNSNLISNNHVDMKNKAKYIELKNSKPKDWFIDRAQINQTEHGSFTTLSFFLKEFSVVSSETFYSHYPDGLSNRYEKGDSISFMRNKLNVPTFNESINIYKIFKSYDPEGRLTDSGNTIEKITELPVYYYDTYKITKIQKVKELFQVSSSTELLKNTDAFIKKMKDAGVKVSESLSLDSIASLAKYIDNNRPSDIPLFGVKLNRLQVEKIQIYITVLFIAAYLFHLVILYRNINFRNSDQTITELWLPFDSMWLAVFTPLITLIIVPSVSLSLASVDMQSFFLKHTTYSSLAMCLALASLIMHVIINNVIRSKSVNQKGFTLP